MSVSEERQPPPAPSKSGLSVALLVAGFVCLGVFAGFVVLKKYFPLTAAAKVDDELLQQLQNLKFTEAAPAKVASKDWPQWRGANRDGIAAADGVLLDWPEDGLETLWEKPLGRGFSGVVVADGRAFTLFQDGGDEAVICWDAATGDELWRFRYSAKYRNSFGDGPRSTPAIDGDFIFTVGGTGIMHCLRTQPKSAAGEVVWRKDLLPEFNADNLKWGVSFSPLVECELIYINPGGPDGNSLAALDKHTGVVVWKSQDDQAGYSSPIAVRIAGAEQIVYFTEQGLVAVTPDTGSSLWRFPWETNNGCNIATPISFQDHVFISSGYRHGCALVRVDKSTAGFEAKSVFENTRMCNHFSSSVRLGEHIYGFNDSMLTCLSIRTGRATWTEDGFNKGTVVGAGGHLIILGEYGDLALAEANPKAYVQKSKFALAGGCYWTAPTLAQGRLYLRNEKKLVCLDMRQRQ